MVLHAIKFGNTDWLELTWDTLYWRTLVNTGKNLSPIKWKKFT